MSTFFPASPVVIVRTGSANIASVIAAITRALPAGASEPIVTDDQTIIKNAERLVLPGVGAFGAAMDELRKADLLETLRLRLLFGEPTLCICLGMQLLFEGSEESPGCKGLGILPGQVKRLTQRDDSSTASVRVPQMGFNLVRAKEAREHTAGYLEPGFAYFANSYCVKAESQECLHALQEWRVLTTSYAGEFISAIERGGVVACQFHPELSGAWGQDLIRRWLAQEPAMLSAPGSDMRAGVCRRVIPCLDVRDGRVVKGVKFAGLRDAGDPTELAAEYEKQGADELVILDVTATLQERLARLETIRRVRAKLSIPLTVGGGVKGIEDALELLAAGADKVSVNSAAVHDPTILSQLAQRFGRQCTILAIDAARVEKGTTDIPSGYEVVINSGSKRTGLCVVEWAKKAEALGAGEILLTSFDRDGTRSGYDLELLKLVSESVQVPVIASGGAAGPEHLVEAIRSGADAVLAASIFHDGQYTCGQVKQALSRAGVNVRE